MAWFGAKVSRGEVSSIPKNTFSFGIFWRNWPHTSFLGLIGYMVRSGAKLFRMKTLLNFAPLELVFPKNMFSVWIFVQNDTSPVSWAKRTRWRDFGQKCHRAKFRPSQKTHFQSEFFSQNQPQSSFQALIGYMVHSGAKLFRTKTLLNFASQALSNSFFQKTRFRFEFLY